MSEGHTLLGIAGPAGIPGLAPLCARLGVQLTVARTLRQALALLAKQPQIVVAEFIYGPTYGSVLSNFESLYAGLQRHAPQARLIALVRPDDLGHLQRVPSGFPIFEQILLPTRAAELDAAVQRALSR